VAVPNFRRQVINFARDMGGYVLVHQHEDRAPFADICFADGDKSMDEIDFIRAALSEARILMTTWNAQRKF